MNLNNLEQMTLQTVFCRCNPIDGLLKLQATIGVSLDWSELLNRKTVMERCYSLRGGHVPTYDKMLPDRFLTRPSTLKNPGLEGEEVSTIPQGDTRWR